MNISIPVVHGQKMNERPLQLPRWTGYLRVYDTALPLCVIVNDNANHSSYVTCSIDVQLQRPPNPTTSTRGKHHPCANVQNPDKPRGPKTLDNARTFQ